MQSLFLFLFLIFSGNLLIADNLPPDLPSKNASYMAGSEAVSPETTFCCSRSACLEQLKESIREEPFRIFTFLMFAMAVLHALFAGKIHNLSMQLRRKHREKMLQRGEMKANKVCFWAELAHICGEVEAAFGLWVIPLALGYTWYFGWHEMVQYFESRNYIEPTFVVIIMAIASTRPVLRFAEYCLQSVVFLFGGDKPSTWWLAILTTASILGSFITEPAAMTIGALLLAKHIYELRPSKIFAYSTLGLLFVNVSVGGVLTNFAAPPVLMVAHHWGWSSSFMFVNFGIDAIIGVFSATLFYRIVFSKELKRLDEKKAKKVSSKKEGDWIPWRVIIVHLVFLSWTVFNAHSITLAIGGFLFFLAFLSTTQQYQHAFSLRGPLMVGFFLAGLVIHGGLQSWWIQPVLSAMCENTLFWCATALSPFNDNAAITYLASLVEAFKDSLVYQKAIIGGAVVGGGLTVIANAPNPAGQSILAKYFPNGIVSPVYLFLAAAAPTIFMIIAFRYLPT